MTRAQFVALFAAGSDTPIYGSPEWEALDPTDARRFASVVRAAECWRLEGTDEAIRDRLVDDIEFSNRFTAWRIRMLSSDLSTAANWSAISRRTPIAELRRLRAYETGVA